MYVDESWIEDVSLYMNDAIEALSKDDVEGATWAIERANRILEKNTLAGLHGEAELDFESDVDNGGYYDDDDI